jgi:hypothetical protein
MAALPFFVIVPVNQSTTQMRQMVTSIPKPDKKDCQNLTDSVEIDESTKRDFNDVM